MSAVKELLQASEDSRWLLISTAARIVGVSPQALRDRIKRGTLDYRQLKNKDGRKGPYHVRPCDCVQHKAPGRKPGDRTEADRKAAEWQRRLRARMFWKKKILYGIDQRFLLKNISLKIIKQECRKVRLENSEPVEMEITEIKPTHGNSLPEGMEN